MEFINEHKYSTVYFNWLVKTVTNFNFLLLLTNKNGNNSAWTIDQIDGLYINTSNYEPLLGGSYIPLSKVLNNSIKGLINLSVNESSAWTIDEIDWLYINSSNYEPLLGGSYIPLSKVLNN